MASFWFRHWQEGVVKAHLPLPTTEGFDFREVVDDGSNFIGSYLAKNTFPISNRAALELTTGITSKSGRDNNLTPFQILKQAIESYPKFGFKTPKSWLVEYDLSPNQTPCIVDNRTGEVLEIKAPSPWAIWHTWERISKGKRQIQWSHHIKAPKTDAEQLWNDILNTRGRLQTDTELATKQVSRQTVAQVTRSAWYQQLVWNPLLIVSLLEAVETASPQDATQNAMKWGKPTTYR